MADHVLGKEKRDGSQYAKSEADPEHASIPHVLTDEKELRAKPSNASRLLGWLWFTDRYRVTQS